MGNELLTNLIGHLSFDEEKKFDVDCVKRTQDGYRLNVRRNPEPTETDLADLVIKLYFGGFKVTDAEKLPDNLISIFVKFDKEEKDEDNK